MKAMVYESYGPPEEVLELRHIDVPEPMPDEVLVRVHASSVGPWDWHALSGQPYLFRPMFGFPGPKRNIPGADVAGRVEAVGSSVTMFKPGDKVYGETSEGGGYAEYVSVPAERLGHKPANLTFEQAASMPIAAMTALQGLRDIGKLQPGHQVLINGASGGIGTFAIQIAEEMGAEVTAVCSSRNAELVRSLGAEHVIDYAQEDFTTGDKSYDIILDVVGNHPPARCRRALKADGTYVASFGRIDREWVGSLTQLLKMFVLSPFVSQKMVTWLQTAKTKDLHTLTALVESGAVTPMIDREFELDDAAQALRHQGNGHAQGKTIVKVA